jgi:hypothetical protein
MPVTHTIIIKRKDDDPTKDLILEDTASDGSGIGELESDDAVRLNSGDKVQWISDLGNFCVLFKDEPPFNGNFVTVGNRKGESTLLKVAKKLGGGSAGHPTVLRFSYAVTVVEPSLEDGTLTATTIDPLLDISDSSGGTL